jgi:VPDSG-CTERM motif
MKNRSSKTILVFFALGLISCALCVQQAQAVPISGGISFGGGFTPNTGDLNTATSLSFGTFPDIFVTSVSGSYSSVPTGAFSPPSLTQNPVTFDPFNLPITPLWSFTYLGVTYSFDLLSGFIFDRGTDTLTLIGSGLLMISGGGYDPTAASWILTANQAAGTFSFSSSNGAVPDGGMTVVMLGLALCGIGMIRRKLTS